MNCSRVLSPIVFGLFAISAAFGNIITPGTFLAAPDTFTGQAGLTLLASVTSPFSTANYSGTVSVGVFQDPNNIFGAGDLDFLYQVTNNVGSTTSLNFVGGSAFNGFTTDVGYRIDGASLPGSIFVNGSVIPVGVSNSGAVGGVVSFDFESPGTMIAPGQTSSVLLVATNANGYVPFGSAALQALVLVADGTIETTIAAYQPTATPEPMSGFLICCFVGVMIGVKHFRR